MSAGYFLDVESYDAGFADGLLEGREDGIEQGLREGFSDGYDAGLEEGHAQALGILTSDARPGDAVVYLSSRYARREELAGYAADLAAAGVECTSRWLTTELPDLKDQAMLDFEDLRRSTVLVTFTEDTDAFIDWSEGSLIVPADVATSLARGGRHVEFGLAYAMGCVCIVIGQLENVFHALPGVLQFDTWAECLEYLSA